MAPDPEPMIQVAAIVAGAGVSGTIAGLVKGVVPQIAPDIAAAVAGGLMWWFGERVHPLLKAFGVGVMAGGLKGTIEKLIPPIGGGGGTTTTTTTQASGDILAQLAQAQASIPVIQA